MGFEEVPSDISSISSTVSIALPSSILTNAQSSELRVYLAGQIARAAAVFCIDEIVVFEEEEEPDQSNRKPYSRNSQRLEDPTAFFKLLLEYLETPQYLRKFLFPVSKDLRLVGLLNPLALPSHLARQETSRWREGVAVTRNGAVPLNRDLPPTRYVAVGLQRLVEVDQSVQVGDRVTVDMSPSGIDYESFPGKYLFGKIVDRRAPRKTEGRYWGYQVRTASCLSDVFRGSLVCQNYDLAVGTSERGTPIVGPGADDFGIHSFSHVIVVFGGVHGLERSVRGDKNLAALGISGDADAKCGVADLFDYYVNTCPKQGSKTIRTEEAILISLAALQPHLKPR